MRLLPAAVVAVLFATPGFAQVMGGTMTPPVSPGIKAVTQQDLPQGVDGTFSVIGQGSVRWPGGFCAPKAGESNTVCTRIVAANRQLVFEAIPRPGQEFKGWAGACSGQGPRCLFSPTKKFALSASFAEAQAKRTITVSFQQTPTSKVNLDPLAGSAFTCGAVSYSGPAQNGPAGPYNTVCTVQAPAGEVTITGNLVQGGVSTKIPGGYWKGDCIGPTATGCRLAASGDLKAFVGPGTPTKIPSLTIYMVRNAKSNPVVKAMRRAVVTPMVLPPEPTGLSCDYIIAPMGMPGPGGYYNWQCKVTLQGPVAIDLTGANNRDGQSTPLKAGDWLGTDCIGTPDQTCSVLLDRDRRVFIKP